MRYPERSVSAAPSVLVVGACQESVAVPLLLLVAEVPADTVDRPVGSWWQPTSTHAASARTPANFTIFKAQTPSRSGTTGPQRSDHKKAATGGGEAAGQQTPRGVAARCMPVHSSLYISIC